MQGKDLKTGCAWKKLEEMVESVEKECESPQQHGDHWKVSEGEGNWKKKELEEIVEIFSSGRST